MSLSCKGAWLILGRKATCELLLPLRTRGRSCPEDLQSRYTLLKRPYTVELSAWGKSGGDKVTQILVLRHPKGSRSWNLQCLWGERVAGVEDKPGKVPQSVHEWKVSFSVCIWFSARICNQMARVTNSLLGEGLRGHEPQASGCNHPCPYIRVALATHCSLAPSCAGGDGAQTRPVSFSCSFSLRLCIYSFFNL